MGPSTEAMGVYSGGDTPDALGDVDLADLKVLARALYPHDELPDGPYERVAEIIAAELNASPHDLGLMRDGLATLRGRVTGSIGEMDSSERESLLGSCADTEFFELLRSRTLFHLYDDREVWEFLGYPGPSFDLGGYLTRGFNDLSWLPDPRIAETDEPETDLGPLPYAVAAPSVAAPSVATPTTAADASRGGEK